MRRENAFRYLILIALLLAVTVTILGATVRLSNAGLSCPDWPGCYGHLLVPTQEQAALHADHAARPLQSEEAWKEMIHRYLAGLLGLLNLLIAAAAWHGHRRRMATLVLVLTGFQALLGMWTVTLLLMPLIVVLHLLGGMTLIGLLSWMWLDEHPHTSVPISRPLQWSASLGIIALMIQIALGGWTSANYAALACPDFPGCQNQWWPNMDFRAGFTLWHGLGSDHEGGTLSTSARAAIHTTHRIGAILILLFLGSLAIQCLRQSGSRALRYLGGLILFLLCLQVLLGIATVLTRLAMPLAIGHNATAALLLISTVSLLHRCRGGQALAITPRR